MPWDMEHGMPMLEAAVQGSARFMHATFEEVHRQPRLTGGRASPRRLPASWLRREPGQSHFQVSSNQ